MSDAVDREFRLAFWKIHILHHAEERPIYGLWMLQELAEHGHRLSPGTLYPILTRMEKLGWLRSDGNGSSKARRNFRITARGKQILKALRRDLVELHSEVVAGRTPRVPSTEGTRARQRSLPSRGRSKGGSSSIALASVRPKRKKSMMARCSSSVSSSGTNSGSISAPSPGSLRRPPSL